MSFCKNHTKTQPSIIPLIAEEVGGSPELVYAALRLLKLSEQRQQLAQVRSWDPPQFTMLKQLSSFGYTCAHIPEVWPCVCQPQRQQWQALTTTTEAGSTISRGKITWHQNSRFKLREENKSLSTYSRVMLENLIRCTAAEMCYLTVATYINKSVT